MRIHGHISDDLNVENVNRTLAHMLDEFVEEIERKVPGAGIYLADLGGQGSFHPVRGYERPLTIETTSEKQAPFTHRGHEVES